MLHGPDFFVVLVFISDDKSCGPWYIWGKGRPIDEEDQDFGQNVLIVDPHEVAEPLDGRPEQEGERQRRLF